MVRFSRKFSLRRPRSEDAGFVKVAMSGEVSMPSLRAEHRARAIVQGIRHKRIARSGVFAAVIDAGIDIAFGLIMLLLLGVAQFAGG